MRERPRVLDLFCGGGGMAAGFVEAGFDVLGVDNRPQPRYPFDFYEGDALEFLQMRRPGGYIGGLSGFDAIHASPPCQDYSTSLGGRARHGTAWLLPSTLELLEAQDLPWVVENVMGAPLSAAQTLFPGNHGVMLCGSMFGLGVRRHRLFQTSFPIAQPQCAHGRQGRVVSVSGHSSQGREYRAAREEGREPDVTSDRAAAMGIDWMSRDELAQAIPPAYARYIGTELLRALGGEPGAA